MSIKGGPDFCNKSNQKQIDSIDKIIKKTNNLVHTCIYQKVYISTIYIYLVYILSFSYSLINSHPQLANSSHCTLITGYHQKMRCEPVGLIIYGRLMQCENL